MTFRTIGDCIQWAAQQLAEAGLENAFREALLLMAEASGLPRTLLIAHPELPLERHLWARLRRWVERRVAGEPFAYIIGSRWFYGLEFLVTSDVLIPRPETETLVDLFLEWQWDRHWDERPILVDVGTGSGCIAIACLVHAPHWLGIGIDRSFKAFRVARQNRQRHGLKKGWQAREDRLFLLCGDWLTCLADRSVHAVLSNPPYVAKAELEQLPPEIRDWEPLHALVDSDGDGLGAYRRLLPQARRVLQPGGLIAVEIGMGQSEAVVELFHQAGWHETYLRKDLHGIPRVVWSTLS